MGAPQSSQSRRFTAFVEADSTVRNARGKSRKRWKAPSPQHSPRMLRLRPQGQSP